MEDSLYEVTGLDESSPLPNFTDEGPSISYEDDSMLMPSTSAPPGHKDDSGGLGGLGSLADELAGAMYDSDEEYDEEGGDVEMMLGEAQVNGAHHHHIVSGYATKDDSIKKAPVRPLSASDYDGSEYGDPEDLGNGISVGLEDKINQIENLALRNRHMLKEEESGVGELAGVMPRLMEGLQNLAPQSSLETGSMRLITAHAALTSNMTHQARTIRDLSLSINSAYPPAEDTSDLLLSLLDLIPRPSPQPLAELSNLHSLTLSLVSQLSFLSDSLHMARQSSIAATRKLRVAREACADWKHELEAVEKAKRWIEDGDWEARCKRREAAGVCAEVTGGFEDVCKGFEERLKAQGVGVSA